MSQSDTLTIIPLITDHIDIWTSSILAKSTSGRGSSKKYELYGITKLRELILELAVRGKLVPQDPNDEPASVLLEKIATEKAELLKEGKTKRGKHLPKISKNEQPFDLPLGWEWIHINEIVGLENGDRGKNYPNKSSLVDEGIPFINAGQLEGGVVSKKDLSYITQDRFDILNGGKFRNGDILFCLRGSLGKCALVSNFGIGAIASSLIIMRPIMNHLEHFMMLVLNSPLTKRTISKYNNGTAQPNLSGADLARFPVPLPPLKEQHRIVAKVDELMLLCDQLEQQTEASIKAHATLVEVLLATLTDSTDANELAQNWARLSENFDSLFTTEQSIEAFKQTALQLAVMGKLVPQNPDDEPASVLLEKIAEEKDKLVKEKKIKRAKPLPLIDDDEKPFELPRGWEWCRVAEISNLKGGFAYKSSKFSDSGKYQVVRMGNIRPDYLRLDTNSVFIPKDLAENTEDYRLDSGDVLLTMTGTKGKKDYLYSLVVSDSDLLQRQLYLNQRLCRVRPILIDVGFLNIAIKENRLMTPVFSKSTGSANQANIGIDAISNWVVPLPPVNEQHRIIFKFDALMKICDHLKNKLQQSQVTQVQLTDALVEQALA